MGKFPNLYFYLTMASVSLPSNTFVLLNVMAFVRFLKPQHPEDTGKVKMF